MTLRQLLPGWLLASTWMFVSGCTPPPPTTTPTEDVDGDGYTTTQGDCDDLDRHTYPGASEVPYDSIDQDCLEGDLIDVDLDGYPGEMAGGEDCDDFDATVYPGATDITDGKDNDCDGGIDGVTGNTMGVIDHDRDGYASAASGGNDCDDNDPSVHPGAVDTSGDGIDQDCSGTDATQTTGVDEDGDGYTSTESGGDDPDDSDPDIHPGAYDPPGDGIDQDGSGEDGPGVIKVDRDKDGYASIGTGGTDCDDYDNDIHPGATDVADNGIDEDCDGKDDGTAAPVDVDADGFSSLETGGTDCDDRDPTVHPGAVDAYGDGIDQDCNGTDGTGAVVVAVPVDADRDGYAASYAGGNDCNDRDPTIHPGAVDYGGDGIDQDCDGSDPEVTTGTDADGDGYTSGSSGGDDPDDSDPSTHPGAEDPLGDGIDQDGSGADGTGVVPYDHDGDGEPSTGTGGQDCDDQDPGTLPTTPDIPGNGIDEDCDGLDGGEPIPVDDDHDGYFSPYSGGDDCNDLEPAIHPGAADSLGDCVDQDCSGADGTEAASPFGEDADADGFISCAGGGADCDDTRSDVHPGATDFAYNGVDEDCSGSDLVDFDRDGYAGTEVSYGTDCNDTRDDVHPNAIETPYNGEDEDCNGKDLVDVDLDGYAALGTPNGTDCDDTRASVNPGAADIPYDGIDQDCLGGDQTDVDDDGFTSSSVGGGNDCNDSVSTIYPGAVEVADGQDNDCDGLIDDHTPLYDDDLDGFSEVQGDCNDLLASIHPGVNDIPDGLDNNCDGTIDETDIDPPYSTDDGWNFYLAGELTQAGVAFTQALQADPFDADAFNGMGWTRFAQGELEAAAEYFEVSLALMPELTEALAGAAGVALLEGRPDVAATLAMRCLMVAPYPTFRYGLATEERVLVMWGQASVPLGALVDARRALDGLEPGHGLNPYEPSSWKVGAVTFGSYRAALMTALANAQASLE